MDARHYSQLYRQLRDVDPRDFQRMIRMYEDKEAEIGRLDPLEHFELTVYYVDALFQTGAYRQHQMMVDLPIEACMRYNIERAEGIEGDVFEHLLFSKAASAFRMRLYDEAAHVLRELIRINPDKELYVRFLRAAEFQRQRSVLQNGRGVFIACMLVAAAVIVLEILLLRSLFEHLLPWSQRAIAVVFLGGVSYLTGAYGYAYWRAHRTAYRFRAARANK